MGDFGPRRECPQCKGTGRIIVPEQPPLEGTHEQHCPNCGGVGWLGRDKDDFDGAGGLG